MEYRATAAVPCLDAGRAVSGLRARLRAQAEVEQVVVDWDTLRVTGPVEVVGARGRVWYEWTATARAKAPVGARDGGR
jgi:hypothetical protein